MWTLAIALSKPCKSSNSYKHLPLSLFDRVKEEENIFISFSDCCLYAASLSFVSSTNSEVGGTNIVVKISYSLFLAGLSRVFVLCSSWGPLEDCSPDILHQYLWFLALWITDVPWSPFGVSQGAFQRAATCIFLVPSVLSPLLLTFQTANCARIIVHRKLKFIVLHLNQP